MRRRANQRRRAELEAAELSMESPLFQRQLLTKLIELAREDRFRERVELLLANAEALCACDRKQRTRDLVHYYEEFACLICDPEWDSTLQNFSKRDFERFQHLKTELNETLLAGMRAVGFDMNGRTQTERKRIASLPVQPIWTSHVLANGYWPRTQDSQPLQLVVDSELPPGFADAYHRLQGLTVMVSGQAVQPTLTELVQLHSLRNLSLILSDCQIDPQFANMINGLEGDLSLICNEARLENPVEVFSILQQNSRLYRLEINTQRGLRGKDVEPLANFPRLEMLTLNSRGKLTHLQGAEIKNVETVVEYRTETTYNPLMNFIAVLFLLALLYFWLS